MKLNSIKASLICCCFVALDADAAVTFNVNADLLKDQNGAAMVQSGLVLLVADTAANGFGAVADGASLALSGAIGGAGGDDLVLFRWALGGSSGTNGAFYDTTGSLNFGDYAGWNAPDPLALLWFPDLTLASTTALGGSSYGIYSNPGSPSSSAWVTPPDGTPLTTLDFFTSDGAFSTGVLAAGLGNASLTVAAIPEPSRALLGMIGLTALGLRRRRR